MSFKLTGGFSPLCVEEFDLSDKNFRPCPCGYQVSGEVIRLEERRFADHENFAAGLPVLLQQYQE